MAPSLRSLVKNALFDRVPGLLRRGPTSAKRVALTFDDGPDAMTHAYLDLLDQLAAPATFFVVGKHVEAHPELVAEYVRRGHQIAGHGYDHTRFTKLSRAQLLEQCARTERVLGEGRGSRPWVRPPYGALDAKSLISLRAAGYVVALWSIDPEDYSEKDATTLAARCAPGVVNGGDVLLFHEGQQWTLDALPVIVGALRTAGFELVTMRDLVEPRRT